MQEADQAVDRLAAVPTEPGFVFNDIQLVRMRAQLAKAHDDETGYRTYRTAIGRSRARLASRGIRSGPRRCRDRRRGGAQPVSK